MKSCPYCQIPHCEHERKFFEFGLVKLIIIQKSLDATISIFSKLMNFLPANVEMQLKLSTSLDDLKKSQERMNDVKKWCEGKITT